MALEYKILGQELVSYSDTTELVDTTSYYVSYEETISPRFVALGPYNDKTLYSDDGINWSVGGTVPSISWQSVTFGANKFVAVGYGTGYFPGSAAYSTDGINWTPTSLPVSQYWENVKFGNGRFVAVGGNLLNTSLSAYSTDGITWIPTTMPGVKSWKLGYGDGKFVAVADNDSMAAYSTDGITWTQTSLPMTNLWYSMAFGAGTFVLVGYNSSVALISSDGINWTTSNLPQTMTLEDIVYADGKFVAPLNGSSPAQAIYSADGINWSFASLPSLGYWRTIVYGNGRFIAAAETFGAYSADGITWTIFGLPDVYPGNDYWIRMAFGEIYQLTETLNIIGGQGTAQTEQYLPVTFYTVPEGKQTTVTSVFVANHNDTATTYDFAVVPAGEELSLKHHIRWDMEIAANDFENISTKITMSAGDSLVIFPSTVDTVSVTAFGVEK